MSDKKIGEESRFSESGVEMEVRKTEIAMGIALKVTYKDWEKNGKKMIDRWNRRRSKRKVRGIKNTMKKEIMVNSPMTTVMPRK